MPFSIARSLNIFLSYAHEDQKIADAIASILRMAFFDTFDVTLMSEFPIGVNWRELISESIEKTDILIAIASGRLKPSHSFTGFEIGSFTTSMRHRPNMELASTVVRRMIPFAALDRRPTTTGSSKASTSTRRAFTHSGSMRPRPRWRSDVSRPTALIERQRSSSNSLVTFRTSSPRYCPSDPSALATAGKGSNSSTHLRFRYARHCLPRSLTVRKRSRSPRAS
jgi:TIR domain